jgi:hypothetical protein
LVYLPLRSTIPAERVVQEVEVVASAPAWW